MELPPARYGGYAICMGGFLFCICERRLSLIHLTLGVLTSLGDPLLGQRRRRRPERADKLIASCDDLHYPCDVQRLVHRAERGDE